MWVRTRDAAGAAGFELGAVTRGRGDGLLDIVHGETDVLHAFARAGDVLREAPVSIRRLAELNLDLAEGEVRFARATFGPVETPYIAHAQPALVGAQSRVHVGDRN